MKKGCLFIIAVMVGAFFGYRQLIEGTELEEKWWIALLFAIGAGIVVANVMGIFTALRQKAALNKPRTTWQDGELVAVTGRIQASRTPITAPFSGIPAAIAEYEINWGDSENPDSPASAHYAGFLMAPCAVYSQQGAVKLVGFPILTETNGLESEGEISLYQRAGEYLAGCTFQDKATNPLQAIKQLTDVLNDDDGELRADFCVRGANLHIVDSHNDQVEPTSTMDTADPSAPIADAVVKTSAEQIAEKLANSNYTLTEKIIANGAEVTAIGSYRATRHAIDIGSGLSNLSHSLKLGAASTVIGKTFNKSLFATIFWGGVFVAGNWYVCKLVGVDMTPILKLVDRIRL